MGQPAIVALWTQLCKALTANTELMTKVEVLTAWVIDATNVTDAAIPITFGSAQVAEVTVSDGSSELYRWSNGKTFTQAMQEVDFAAGRSAGATLADPFAVAPGTDYTLRAWITGIGAEDVVVTAPVEVIQN